jgi:hypothetical protein
MVVVPVSEKRPKDYGKLGISVRDRDQFFILSKTETALLWLQ